MCGPPVPKGFCVCVFPFSCLESDATSRHDQACSSQAGDGVPEEEACLTNNVLTCSEPKLHSPLLTFQLLGGAHCQFCRLISSVCVCACVCACVLRVCCCACVFIALKKACAAASTPDAAVVLSCSSTPCAIWIWVSSLWYGHWMKLARKLCLRSAEGLEKGPWDVSALADPLCILSDSTDHDIQDSAAKAAQSGKKMSKASNEPKASVCVPVRHAKKP